MEKSNGNNEHQLNNETERIMANPYLIRKLARGRKDMKNDKGVKLDLAKFFSLRHTS